MSQENVEIVRRLYDLWNSRAFAAAIQLYDPDIEYSRIGSEVPDFECEARGVDEMRGSQGLPRGMGGLPI